MWCLLYGVIYVSRLPTVMNMHTLYYIKFIVSGIYNDYGCLGLLVINYTHCGGDYLIL